MTNTIYIHQPEKAFSFTRLPNFLFEAPTFKPLSNEAKGNPAVGRNLKALAYRPGCNDRQRIAVQFVFVEIGSNAHSSAQAEVHHGKPDLEGVRGGKERAHRRVSGQITHRSRVVKVSRQNEPVFEDAVVFIEGNRRQIERIEVPEFSHDHLFLRWQIYGFKQYIKAFYLQKACFAILLNNQPTTCNKRLHRKFGNFAGVKPQKTTIW